MSEPENARDPAADATLPGPTGTGHAQPRYMLIWAVLAVLTLVEVGVAFVGFDRAATVLALVGLAIWKAGLVAMYFMHLRYESNALRLLAIAPLGPAVIFVLLVLLEY